MRSDTNSADPPAKPNRLCDQFESRTYCQPRGKLPRPTAMLLDTVATDVRFAVRRLARTPIFTLAAVAVMALGIGANTAVFTALDQTVIRPLPFREPQRLVMLWEDYSALGRAPKQRVAPATLLDWRALNRSFEVLGAF